jgi:hypothetical protein
VSEAGPLPIFVMFLFLFFANPTNGMGIRREISGRDLFGAAKKAKIAFTSYLKAETSDQRGRRYSHFKMSLLFLASSTFAGHRTPIFGDRPLEPSQKHRF